MVSKVFKKLIKFPFLVFSGLFWYIKDLFLYKKMTGPNKRHIALFPQIFDKDPSSHTFDKHYVYMDRWAFKKVLDNHPVEHVDVGSSIRFLSMASAVTKLKFVDIRPVKLDFDNFECIEGSILKLPFADNSVSSLSCLHVAEHIGLGRYGDPLDPEGTIKACKELARVLAPGGTLYFALPIGKAGTYFNAHRVHDPRIILEYFKDLRLVSFAAIGDDGHFCSEADMEKYRNAHYACGCFEFRK